MDKLAEYAPQIHLKIIVVVLLSRHQSQHHEDEKRALSREIIVLNNHLMEAKLTIDKLQEDNVRHCFHSNQCCKLALVCDVYNYVSVVLHFEIQTADLCP